MVFCYDDTIGNDAELLARVMGKNCCKCDIDKGDSTRVGHCCLDEHNISTLVWVDKRLEDQPDADGEQDNFFVVEILMVVMFVFIAFWIVTENMVIWCLVAATKAP